MLALVKYIKYTSDRSAHHSRSVPLNTLRAASDPVVDEVRLAGEGNVDAELRGVYDRLEQTSKLHESAQDDLSRKQGASGCCVGH